MGSAGGRSVALRESGYVQSNEDEFGVNLDGTSKQHNESVRRVELAPEIMALVWLPQLQTCEERARERQALAPRNLGAPRLRRLTALIEETTALVAYQLRGRRSCGNLQRGLVVDGCGWWC